MRHLLSVLFAFVLCVLFATSACAIQATFTWTDNSINEDGFRVERRDGADTEPWVEQLSTLPDVTSFNQAGLNLGTRYCYRVVAFNLFGDAPPTPEACGTPDVPLPASGSMVIFSP